MKHLAIIAVTTAFAATLNASDLPDSFLGTLDLGPKVDMTQTETIRGCTDFTGSWKGFCKAAEQSKEESFSTKQKGCEFLEVTSSRGGKMTLPIGGVFSGGGSIPGAPAVTFGGTIESNWNKEHTVLNLLMSGGGKKLSIDDEPNGGMIKENMKLEGGKLIVGFSAYHSKGKVTGTCEFLKQ